MSARMIRTLALGVGAAALVVGAAAPAMADDSGVGASKLSIPTNTAAKDYQVMFEEGSNPVTPCPANVTSWSAKTASKQMTAIVVAPTASCADGKITVNVATQPVSKKKNAVIKVIGVSSTDATVKVVKTIVVKVTGTAKPGKGPKN